MVDVQRPLGPAAPGVAAVQRCIHELVQPRLIRPALVAHHVDAVNVEEIAIRRERIRQRVAARQEQIIGHRRDVLGVRRVQLTGRVPIAKEDHVHPVG